MSERELVIQALTARMMRAFSRGDLADAQNLEAFITVLEEATDADFTAMADDRDTSTIA